MQVSPTIRKVLLDSNEYASKLFFCLSSLCSVLDLNAFERQNKAEGLGMVSEEGTSKSPEHHIHYSSSRLSATFEGQITLVHILRCICCSKTSHCSKTKYFYLESVWYYDYLIFALLFDSSCHIFSSLT